MPLPARAEEPSADSQHGENANRARLDMLLSAAQGGCEAARGELFQFVYDELRAAAHRLMRSSSGHTLPPTALVNEVMVQFLERPKLTNLPNGRCLFAVAIKAMETMLIDHRRRKTSLKRGGGRQRIPLDAVLNEIEAETGTDYGVIHESLERLEEHNARQCEVVRLRFFGGMTIQETASTLGISEQTVQRDWRLARAKLYRDLKDDSS